MNEMTQAKGQTPVSYLASPLSPTGTKCSHGFSVTFTRCSTANLLFGGAQVR
jgi:hypothetical protein